MSNEPTGGIHELRRLAVSILGTVIMAWIAVKLLVSIWEPLLAIVISITVIAVFLRWWHWRKW